MKKLISFRKTVQMSLFIFGLLFLFHLSIIVGVLFFDFAPVDFLWGGRLETAEKLLSFEIFSILIMVLCILIVLVKSGKLNFPKALGAVRIALWFLFFMFLLNTIGNVLAKTIFEKSFAIITAILAFLSLRLALEKNHK